MTLIVLDEEELEFLEAVKYYEQAAGLGAPFRDEVSAGVAWILENPRVLRLRPGNIIPSICAFSILSTLYHSRREYLAARSGAGTTETPLLD
jgi:hypothetical protein